MGDHRRCRLSVDGGELELAGPPTALRALGQLLRQGVTTVEVVVAGGAVAQEVTAGPLLVALAAPTTVRFSGGPEYLDLVWDALDGVADQAEMVDEPGVKCHQHLEYLPGDDYRSPDSMPLVIVADWPDEPVPPVR